MRSFLLLVILFLSAVSFSQEEADSIIRALGLPEAINRTGNSSKDTIILKEAMIVADEYLYSNPQIAEQIGYSIYYLANKIDHHQAIAFSMRLIGKSKMMGNDLDSAIIYADQAIEYALKYDLKFELMESYSLRGNGYFYTSEYQKAISMYLKAVEIAEAHFPHEAAGAYGSIGLVFKIIGNTEKSKEYCERSYQLSIMYRDTSSQMFALNNLGILAKNEGDLELAVKYYEEGLELAVLTGNLKREGEISYNLANVYFKLGNNEAGLRQLERSSEITAIIGNDRDKAIEHHNLGFRYYELKDYKKAEPHAVKALELARKTGYWEVEMESSSLMADILFQRKDYKGALSHMRRAYHLKDSLNLTETNALVMDIENNFREEKEALADSLKQVQETLIKEHDAQLNEEKLKARNNLLYVSLGIILIIILALILLFRINKKVKAKNEIITLRNEQIVSQKLEIEEQHKEIKDSINYAERIQRALLTDEIEWQKIGRERMVYFNPKDIVSGDFYWAAHLEKQNISIWVAADCTGHGVPGAFMSMLGIGFLNEIVLENNILSGAEILGQLRQKIIKALEQKGETLQKDGMDMALCILHHKTNSLEYTGANNPLWILRKTDSIADASAKGIYSDESCGWSILDFNPDKMPVGFLTENSKPFSSQVISVLPDDVIITFSDGFADQFGGDKGKKLKYKPFKDILINQHDIPLSEYPTILDQTFNSWKGQLEQTDDVCIIAVKV